MNWLMIIIGLIFVVNFPKAALFLMCVVFGFTLIGVVALLTAPVNGVGRR